MTEAIGGLQVGQVPFQPEAREPRRPRSYRIRLPMQAAVSVGVILLLAVVIAGLSWQAYRSSQQALLSASQDTIGLIRDAMAQKTRRILEPAEAQLDFLIRGSLSTANTITERLRQMPLMADALQKNPLLDAIYAGYPDGEFVLFRAVRDDAIRKQLTAPQDATLVVQSITNRPDGTIVGEYRFFDATNTLLEVRLDPKYRFDPRTRGWYRAAVNQTDFVLTDPYIFFTTNQVGITLAQRTVDAGAVVGLDLKLRTIAEQVEQLKITPSAEVALVNRKEQVIGYRDSTKMIVRDFVAGPRLVTVKELGVAPLLAAYNLSAKGPGQLRATVDIDGRTWQAIQTSIEVTQSRTLKLLVAIPDDEFFSTARTLVWRQLQIAGLIMLVAILGAWWLTKLIVAPLRRLARETERIERFDFTADERIGSRLHEIDGLGRALYRMKRTIRKFLNIGHALAAEKDFRSLLERVLLETIDVVRSDGGAIFMLDDAQTAITAETVRWVRQRSGDAAPGIAQGLHQGGLFARLNEAVRSREVVVADHRLEVAEIAALGLTGAVEALQTSRFAFVIVPLLDRNQVPFGLLVLNKAVLDQAETWRIDDRVIRLIHAVSGNASVAIQNKLLLEAQRKLIDALIKLVAGAIDAKSAYTGGHCQRVPALTRLLAEAAVAQTEGPYRDFSLTDEEWEALDIAAWLHDCGKVTTPEYVVDKATKLETIYDRIHEVRLRFEVLKRDAEIAYWRGLAGGGNEADLRREMEAAKQALDDDFAFVARSNEGGEFMEPEKVARIKAIAARRWTRTISNRLGVSYEEGARMRRQPEPPLPVEEPLLSDRDDHISELTERDIIAPDNKWGFTLTVPKVKFNRGEVYNLCVARGTLTEEERYRINDHIVQTIIMLESLPLPKHLRNVPELAGGHHEKMDGTGYPKRLRGGDMSPVARIMAIADVFEALTAADRPYKKAKKLSEAVKIMGFMKKDNHLDPELLDLFLTSGVWREYARRFLAPDQIDEPDIAAVLGIKPAMAAQPRN